MKSFDSRVSLLHTFVEYHVRKAMTDYIRFWLYKNRTTGSSPKIRSITGVKSESDPKKQKIVDIADARQDPEMHYIRNRELWKFIRICCLGMPERYPLILYMYYMLEMEVNEIKRELGVTAGRVSQMKKEAAKRFLLRAANLKIQGTHEFYPRRCS
jgi:RNA polymerase sigma factor (sigma-70 family)